MTAAAQGALSRCRSIARLVLQNLYRNRKHNILSGFGIIVGVATLTFFLGLDHGIRKVVLGEIFPIDRFEVIAPKASFLGSSKILDDKTVKALRDPKGDAPKPKAVYPRMKVLFPARGWGGAEFLGRDHDFFFEVGGFCDGVDPRIVTAKELNPQFPFKDWDIESGSPIRCGTNNSCPEGRYCAWDIGECLVPVPGLISRHMLELYNGSIAPTHPGLPKISDFVASMFLGKTVTVELGRSHLGSKAVQGGKPIQRKVQLVGISDKAIRLGITVPLGYVQRWNERFAGVEAGVNYSSIVVVVDQKRDMTTLTSYVRSLGYDLQESEGERIGIFITIATALFALISIVIILISAINIAHTFLMLITDRRREIAVMRALGATRGDIRWLILSEAGAMGIVASAMGVALGYGFTRACDWLSRHYLPEFPFKPDSYFSFTVPILAATLSFGVLFCLVGALVPALRAARMDPASALSDR